jgi:hypothetical protein
MVSLSYLVYNCKQNFAMLFKVQLLLNSSVRFLTTEISSQSILSAFTEYIHSYV